jgi:hypothetical protein
MKLINPESVESRDKTGRNTQWRFMKVLIGALLALTLFLAGIASGGPQTASAEIKTATLLKRTMENGVDNFPYAAFSFALGGNGPDVQKLCHNNWDLLFGNSPLPDAFDVTMLTSDRSRIKDLGRLSWDAKFAVPILAAYEEPEHEPSVKAIEGHIYLVHSRDTYSDLYALFRVEKLDPGKSVDISWKTIPRPQRP